VLHPRVQHEGRKGHVQKSQPSHIQNLTFDAVRPAMATMSGESSRQVPGHWGVRPVRCKPGTPTIPKPPALQNPLSEWLQEFMGAEAGSHCRRGQDKDVSSSYAISGAHDETSGRRESRWEIRSGAWKLREIKETPPSAEIE